MTFELQHSHGLVQKAENPPSRKREFVCGHATSPTSLLLLEIQRPKAFHEATLWEDFTPAPPGAEEAVPCADMSLLGGASQTFRPWTISDENISLIQLSLRKGKETSSDALTSRRQRVARSLLSFSQ